MKPIQDDGLARRREQNRLAQRRFRWRQSQQKAATRQEQWQQEASVGRSQDGPEQQQNESATDLRPLGRLVTPSPSSDDTGAILSPDISPTLFDTISEPTGSQGGTSIDAGPNARTNMAYSIAMGMGGLLGDHTVWDSTDLGAISPPLSTSGIGSVGGLMIVSQSGSVSLGVAEEAAIGGKVNAMVQDATSDGHHHQYQPMFEDRPPRDPITTRTPELQRDSQAVSSSIPATLRSISDISDNAVVDASARDSPPSPQSQPPPTSLNSRSRHGPDPNRGWLGPLHLAAARGHDRIVRMLLKRQQIRSVDEQDSDGLTALMHAVQGGFEDVAGTLLDAGAAVDVADERGRTALHWAALSRRGTLLRQLLDHGAAAGANLDVYDDDGRTPLHSAINIGFEAGVEVMLEFGASVSCKTQKKPL